MADSKVEIWNLALANISASGLVASESENSLEAEKCRLYYDTCYGVVIRSIDWTFARKRAALALTGTAPANWEYQYVYPSDCAKVQRIYNPLGDNLPIIEYRIAKHPSTGGLVIWTDQVDAELIYSERVEDIALFDDQFVMMLSHYLASKLAMPITGSREKASDQLTMYQLERSGAQAVDANEDHVPTVQEAPWIEDRG